MAIAAPALEVREPRVGMQPMGLGLSLLFFGIPALAVLIGLHFVMPGLIAGGMVPFYAYFIGTGVPLAGILIASLVAYRLEPNPSERTAFLKRFRYARMDRVAWLWTAVGFIAIFLVSGVMLGVTHPLLLNRIIPVPAYLPAFLNPLTPLTLTGAYSQAFGGLEGNWASLFVFALFLFFNIVGEEFWWRGYILPRQELTFGKWTWVVHGALWTLFHFFKWWDLINILPMTFGLTLVVARLRNNTPGFILHLLLNGIPLVFMLFAVLGIAR